MKSILNTVLLVSLLAMTSGLSAQDAAPIDDVSKEATRLEGELGKYKDTAPEAGEALYQLTQLYHSNGRVFGLVRSAQRFVAAHPTDQRHAEVMLKLLDGLEALTRHKELTVIGRQFLTRYPQAAQCAEVEERVAYTLEKMGEKMDAAEAYRARWSREPNANGRRFGVKACELFSQAGTPGVLAGAELAEEMFDRLPKDEFARHIGVRSYYEWRRARDWAKANVVGNKLVKSGLLKDAEEKREVLRTMAEHYGYLGQHSNAVEMLKGVRQIRDDQWAHYNHIQRMYDSAAPAAQMEPLVKQYSTPSRSDRTGMTALACWLSRGIVKRTPTGHRLCFDRRCLLAPLTHSVASYFYQLNGYEEAQLKNTEQALLAAIPQCEKNNPQQVWYLRYTLGFSIYRDQMKDNAKAKAVLRELVEKAPTNDGNIWNVISWLLSNAESDQEFRADVARILKVRREYAHWGNLRNYPANWVKSASKSKDDVQKQRGAYLEAELAKADQDQVLKLASQMDGRVNGQNDVQIRQQLLKPEIFKTLNTDFQRTVLWGQGYYYQHYSPGDERSNAAMYYDRLTDLDPENFDYRYRYLQVATDYSTPEVAKEAALSMLSTEPTHNNADVWRRLLIAAEKNMDPALAKRALDWRAKSIAKFGPEYTYASTIGDSLTRLEMNNEAVAVWTDAAKPGVNHYESRECSGGCFRSWKIRSRRLRLHRPIRSRYRPSWPVRSVAGGYSTENRRPGRL